MPLLKFNMSDSNSPRSGSVNISSKPQQRTDVEKWEECYGAGVPMVVGGVILGACFSVATFTPFPFIVLSTIGIYSAVENCDNMFRQRQSGRKGATKQDN